MLNILRRSWLVFAVALITISTSAYAESWSSFKDASFTNVSITPSFATDTMTYTVSLASSPMITIAGITYNISWIQGFYALSSDGISTFYAGGSNIVDPTNSKNILWKWDTTPNASSPDDYIVAGWSAQGTEDRILPGNDKSFTYTDFQIPMDTSVILGLHVGYVNNGQQTVVTAFFKETENTSVPEAPASLLVALGGPMIGVASLLRKRFSR
ncbi:hypothetical protein LLG46_11185 [bacterium]|nr:hypothetical protein [bacterium]